MSFESSGDRVSCVIPVYNESQRIGAVLGAVAGHPLVSEVIVVDDASTDDTASIVAAAKGVRLIRLERNRGKTQALCAGIEQSAGQILLLVDGDLVGLTSADITALLAPVLAGRADMSISLRRNTLRLWKLIGMDYISGERVFAKGWLEHRLEALRALPKFGFEVYLNGLCIERRGRIAVVLWPGVRSPFKNAKYGLLRGVRADVRMVLDICRTVAPWRLGRQILAMLRLRVGSSAGPGDRQAASAPGEDQR